MSELAMNTDRELWREKPGDYYSPSMHVTTDGRIGINVGGTVKVRTPAEWHALDDELGKRMAWRLTKANEQLQANFDELLAAWVIFCDGGTSQVMPERVTREIQARLLTKAGSLP